MRTTKAPSTPHVDTLNEFKSQLWRAIHEQSRSSSASHPRSLFSLSAIKHDSSDPAQQALAFLAIEQVVTEIQGKF